MPQLIAMIIIVVGAMIYMFQTFGGTGDKIEGIAQKTSIITEISNIKNGLKLATRTDALLNSGGTVSGDQVKTLQGLAFSGYFAEQINEQLKNKLTTKTDTRNVYNAISFGGDKGTGEVLTTANKSDLQISLVSNVANKIPGLFIDLSKGGLGSNAGFLESQIANDLGAIAYIDRKADKNEAGATALTADQIKKIGTDIAGRIPGTSTTGKDDDGMFIVYFKDFGANEVVK